jgi:ADP-ribosylglycohydrolase
MDADRSAGVLLGTACGDALGAGYEFGPPLPGDVDVTMRGGNGFAPGEWTDDTSMAVAIAQATAAGYDLRTREGLDAVAAGFLGWFRSGPNDVGLQTRAVLRAADSGGGDSVAMSRASAEFLAANPVRGAGNGALMRTAPVALPFLDDDEAGLVEAAQARRCRRPGRRSSPPRCRRTTRHGAASRRSTCPSPSRRPYAGAATRTPWPRSRGACSGPGGARRPFRRAGGG